MCWSLLRHHGRARDEGQGLGGDEPKVHAHDDCNKSMRVRHSRRISRIVFSNSKAFYQILRLSFLRTDCSASELSRYFNSLP